MDFSFLDYRTLLTIGHVFGVAIGAGGAFASDAMFFKTVRDERMTKAELEFLRLGSIMVWTGLAILVLSGTLLFSTDTETYLASSKFLAKITIVAVIALNGIVFHVHHFPRFHRHVDTHFPSSDEFSRHAPLLAASGAISMVSWSSAIILGVISSIPYPYITIMMAYTILLAGAVITALRFHPRIIPSHRPVHNGKQPSHRFRRLRGLDAETEEHGHKE